MTDVRQQRRNMTVTVPEQTIDAAIFGPMNALLLAARMLVAEGYRYEDVNFAFADAMECLQEEPRDANT